jgi:membrane-associated phospholipid phosphatase
LHDVSDSSRQGPAQLALLFSMVAAIVALWGAVTASATVGQFDFAVAGEATAAATQPLTQLVLGITTLGATTVILGVTAIGLALLAIRRHWHGFMTLALSVAATEAVVQLVKVVVERPRPPAADALTQASGFSFPSGHAATAVAVYAVLALLLARGCCGRRRIGLLLAGGLVVLAVGASRVYLGVHYPTDVLAGWLTGAALALGSWLLVTRVRAPDSRLAAG